MNVAVGICIGAQTISIVTVENEIEQLKVISSSNKNAYKNIKIIQEVHNGDPYQILKTYFVELTQKYIKNNIRLVVTGRKFRNIMNVTSISEAEANSRSLEYITEKYKDSHASINAIASLGAETFMLYNIHNGKITNVNAKNKCAAGTGEFFQQQLKRMDLDYSQVEAIPEDANIYKVSGRCSVFCKSDCTHALNKGVEKHSVTAGLCRMLAEKIEELLPQKFRQNQIKLENLNANNNLYKNLNNINTNTNINILLTGGVTKNKLAINYLKHKYSNLIILDESVYFEALGAVLYALENPVLDIPEISNLFTTTNNKNSNNKSSSLNNSTSFNKNSFSFLPALDANSSKVIFKKADNKHIPKNKKLILGIDVGSTTTKAVLITHDNNTKIVASVYIYTNGNPIEAARQCYIELLKQVDVSKNNRIVALGTTGSGRHIVALQAFTNNIINEITAHATAALFYDNEVDTIFEIGGQDAKYTHIINKIPVDYAMNEACSAGTGSFIEEAAKESLGVDLDEIESLALAGKNPPNFSDQCSAFISSDIKTAQQENISRENIIAGLTYSVCQNYLNRVKSNRPIGNKIFMQGGVCYNKAIPIAMATLAEVALVVPPEPGLMGAFGVALQIKEKLELNLIQEKNYNLEKLISRKVTQVGDFICGGGMEKCDLKCKISLIEVEGKKYPFGGICDKYNSNHTCNFHSSSNSLSEEFSTQNNLTQNSLNKNIQEKPEQKKARNLVLERNEIIFKKHSKYIPDMPNGKTIGINNSFYTHNLLPLYSNFFTKLGFNIIVSQNLDVEGLSREHTSFCYPMQQSLCLFSDLIKLNPDFIFVPAVFEMDAESTEKQRLDFNCACAFVTGEPFALLQAYKDIFNLSEKVISPNINFSNGLDTEKNTFVELAVKYFNITNRSIAEEAYDYAVRVQLECQEELYSVGSKFLFELEKRTNEFAIVLFGRGYNSTNKLANKGIPNKFSGNNISIIPIDMFDIRKFDALDRMYWESGNRILKVAEIVKQHPQLFATYITNFACAPDSMILNTFREIMGAKPSLTLELDNHSADAGITTRIEAAVDIISNYREFSNYLINSNISENFRNIIGGNKSEIFAKIEYTEPIATFVSSEGERIPLTDDRVLVLIPAMGDLTSRMFAAVFKSCGMNSTELNIHDEAALQLGRRYASGKECLPILLMAGNLLEYINNSNNKLNKKNKTAEYLVYFQVQGAGNCRLGQYPVFLDQLLRKKNLKNVAQMVLMNEDGFAGLGTDWAIRAVQAIIITDVLDDIRSGILTYATDVKTGLQVFEEEFSDLINKFISNPKDIYKNLEKLADNIKQKVPSKVPIEDFRYVALIGEIFCRRDEFAHKKLNEYFAKNGFVLKTAYISEWIFYIDYLISIDLLESEKSISKRFERMLRNFFMKDAEKKIKRILERSGYYKFERMNIEPLLKHSKHIVPMEYKGEPGLTLGIALNDSLEKYCGIINFGPFACMPTRFAEAITVPEMTIKNKLAAKRLYDKKFNIPGNYDEEFPIPFITIESDGSPYSQLIEARLEAFLLQCRNAENLIYNTNQIF